MTITRSQWARRYRPAIIFILNSIGTYKSIPNGECCFVTAYQLAVLYARFRKNTGSNTAYNIGGKRTGSPTSLAQQIAKHLSADIRNQRIHNTHYNGRLERQFISMKGLDVIRSDTQLIFNMGHVPSLGEFSMFRIR